MVKKITIFMTALWALLVASQIVFICVDGVNDIRIFLLAWNILFLSLNAYSWGVEAEKEKKYCSNCGHNLERKL